MAESTRLKDINARLDTMMAVMEQREERLLAAMDQHDESVNLLEQTLSRLSLILENHLPKLQGNVNDSASVLPAGISEDQDYQAIPSAQMKAI